MRLCLLRVLLAPQGLSRIALVCLTLHSAPQSPAATLVVDPKATLPGDGSPEAPFPSLEAARDALRKKNREPHTVLLRSGLYQRLEPWVLNSQDSGTPEHPIRWKSETPGGALLIASKPIPKEAWQNPTPEEALRLRPEAQKTVRVLDLHQLGIRHSKPYPKTFIGRGGLIELFAGGKRQPLSRWPDGFPEKSAVMGQVLERGKITPAGHLPGRFIAQEDRVGSWQVERGVWLEGYWRAPWEPFTLKVAAIDSASREIRFEQALPNGIGSKYAQAPALGNLDEPWWAINLPEEITCPGEWSVDFPSQRLFWWPPQGALDSDVRIADLDSPVLRIAQARHLILEGLSITGGLGRAVELRDCHFVEIIGGHFWNCGGSGVVIDQGSHNTVRSCDLEDLGESGITLTGGNRNTLEPCHHRADNNHIQRVGVYKKTYAPGILIGDAWNGGGGSGNTVGCVLTRNLIHDTPHAGIIFGGNEHLIQGNEIARTVLTSHDMGAIYTQGDWASRGNRILHNFIHDNPRAVGVYLDDGDSGDLVEGNLFVRNLNGPSICGGHDHRITGNLVFDCSRFGLYIDARGVSRNYGPDSRQATALKALPYTSAPWKDHYPSLLTLFENDPRLPRGNVLSHNAVSHCPKLEYRNAKPHELLHNTLEPNLNLASEDPGFYNANAGDFRLRADAVIFQKLPGFVAPPFEKMGLYSDPFRPNPVRADGRPFLRHSSEPPNSQPAQP